ncbi:helix-turn-helix transcriptional regulator [Niallia taxi]|uniref:XRE family transcriptional regulator n=1 Tax=Niallia taxi TaxID=2499688 RepID=A0A437K7F7_9BACI|nr:MULTISPECIES: helix-turn-helix transcriptional regulator [Niallia]MCM3216745.1 helix-turn-helix transcriptional regulator [Niallia taxi]MDK8642434.1 helix-turn-helix transcriptional regulator [Niallia taxi]MED4040588.1 helix-turn-helix transcriptional regulator [Niallia taxi]MED4057028.1 helix-turn-helix transcriptional regulator [Niallia taxi]MED4121626.1 helix-turn-helix transcriptional regulator [Niallia taxi]
MKFNQITIEDDVERLLILRKRLNLNQFQLAKELKISKSYLVKIENRSLPLSSAFIKKINDYLNREKILYEKNLYFDK